MEVIIRLNPNLMAKILIPKGRVFAMMTRIEWESHLYLVCGT